MRKRNVLIVIVVLVVMVWPITSCSNRQSGYVDGFYTAEVDKFDSHGWKEFITICVSGGKIVTVEYNAKNQSGMIKGWGMDYMRTMNAVAGSYPNQYTRAYGGKLLKDQKSGNIDAISGATHSYHTFEQLAEAVTDLASRGEEQIVFLSVEE